MIVVRTHGGLGNQLFQVGFAMISGAMAGQPVARLHDNRHATKRAPSPLFADLDRPVPMLLSGLSWLRIPKLLSRAGVPVEVLPIGSSRLMDGYFQQPDQWAALPSADVRWLLGELRRRLGIDPARSSGQLVHLRLGDFFADEAAERAHLAERLQGVPAGAVLMSNRDGLLAAFPDLLAARGLHHRPTDGMAPEALLAAMAGFAAIDSNDSTLAFWAGVLGRSVLTLRDARLKALDAAIRAHDA